MPFGLKNAGDTYMRSMTTHFHDMIHKKIDVYMDDVVIKSKKSLDHIANLKKFFNRLWKYNVKVNPAKCAFGVPTEKLLGFIISHWGIELDPSKIKASTIYRRKGTRRTWWVFGESQLHQLIHSTLDGNMWTNLQDLEKGCCNKLEWGVLIGLR